MIAPATGRDWQVDAGNKYGGVVKIKGLLNASVHHLLDFSSHELGSSNRRCSLAILWRCIIFL
jgi:hypothetical protein